MINPEVPTYISFDESCTIDVAVAKMIGWMQSPNRLMYLRVTKYGRILEEMPYMYSLEEPLSELLMELRNGIGQQLIDVAETSGRKLAAVCIPMGEDVAKAAKSRNKNRVIALLDAKSAAIDEIIFRAAKYSRSIRNELRKGDSSELQVEPDDADELSDVRINLDSLDRWSRKNHGVSVFERLETEAPAVVPTVATESKTQNEGNVDGKPALVANPIDPDVTGEPKEIITIVSFDQSAAKNHGVTVLEQHDTAPLSAVSTLAPESRSKDKSGTDEKPWLIRDQRDAGAKLDQLWYTPARYFARQLVREDSTLLLRKHVLATKVAKHMADVGIYKRGGKKAFNPGTILKAFNNMNFG